MQFLKLHVSHLNITTLKDKTRGPMGRIDHLKKTTPRYKTFLHAHRFQTDIKLIIFFSYKFTLTNIAITFRSRNIFHLLEEKYKTSGACDLCIKYMYESLRTILKHIPTSMY